MLKRLCAIATCLLSLTATGQYKIKTEIFESGTWQGTLNGKKITLHVENTEIYDCHMYNYFISGWYRHEGDKIQIPLEGFTNGCEMVLYQFGIQNKNSLETLKNSLTDRGENEFLKDLRFIERFQFNRCNPNEKEKVWLGNHTIGGNNREVQLFADDIFLGKEHQYLVLTNNAKIHLNDVFSGDGGNKLIHVFIGKEEDRILLSFLHPSSSYACGHCGASTGEIGYRIIHLSKEMSIRKTEEVLIESCVKGIYETKTLEKSSRFHRYKVSQSYNDPAYYLTIDIANATIRKSSKK